MSTYCWQTAERVGFFYSKMSSKAGVITPFVIGKFSGSKLLNAIGAVTKNNTFVPSQKYFSIVKNNYNLRKLKKSSGVAKPTFWS